MCYHRVRLVLNNQAQLMSFHMHMEGSPLSQVTTLMWSYDVKALFRSVPIQPAINIIMKHLEEDKELN